MLRQNPPVTMQYNAMWEYNACVEIMGNFFSSQFAIRSAKTIKSKRRTTTKNHNNLLPTVWFHQKLKMDTKFEVGFVSESSAHLFWWGTETGLRATRTRCNSWSQRHRGAPAPSTSYYSSCSSPAPPLNVKINRFLLHSRSLARSQLWERIDFLHSISLAPSLTHNFDNLSVRSTWRRSLPCTHRVRLRNSDGWWRKVQVTRAAQTWPGGEVEDGRQRWIPNFRLPKLSLRAHST